MNRIKDNTIMTLSANVNCNLCNSNELKPFRSLPNYPINSLYISNGVVDAHKSANFKLYVCDSCGHLQGESSIPLSEIYDNEYVQHENPGRQNRRDFFISRTLTYCENQKFNRVIDVGCNDLSLLKEIKKTRKISAKHWIGIDPILIKPENLQDEITFIHGYIQDVVIPFEDSTLPDLIISDQTFEHIPEIGLILKKFSEKLPLNSVFVVCVPSLEIIIDYFGFYSVAHEHVNYFSQYSLSKLFNSCNFSQNFSDTDKDNWGRLLQIHTKSGCNNSANIKAQQPINLLHKFQNNLESYERCLSVVRDILENTEGKIYGFGASDLTANFAYFLKSDLSMLDCIVDDTPYKENMYIPGLKPKIVKSADIDDWSDVTVLITAPQASRAILKRLIELNPKKIISPLNVF